MAGSWSGKRPAGPGTSPLSGDNGRLARPASRPPDPEQGYEWRRQFLEQRAAETSEPVSTSGELAMISFLRGRLPRCYAWLRAPSGAARRVSVLFDSGASHCFIHPRVLEDLGLTVAPNAGPSKLKLTDDHVIKCQGQVSNLQVLAGRYKQRMDFTVVDVGSDDIILGGEVLENAQGGFGAPGFWNMTVDGKVLEIPLIGEHSVNTKVVRLRGVKKSLKLLRSHVSHTLVGRIWKAAPAQGDNGSDNSQDLDVVHGLEGQDIVRQAIREAGASSQRTTSSKSTKHAHRLSRNKEIEKRIEQDKQNMAAASAEFKERLKVEFPTLFQEPRKLPPLRWENHVIDIEPGARAPPVRGLPRMSKAEMDETRKFLTDMLERGWVEPSLGEYGAPFFFVPKPNGRGLRAVCDYRAINSITRKVLPSLPLFENIITQLEGAQ